MGTNCAPSLANLYLYGYESRFIDSLLARQQHEIASQFHMTFRFIDDTLSLNNPLWREYTSRPAEEGGIYPRALTLSDTRISEQETNFLGIKIKIGNKGRITCDVHDKRKDFPFIVQRYPHSISFIPRSIIQGVFTGLLCRFYRICSEPKQFLSHAISLAALFKNRGCGRSVLCRLFHSFIYKHYPLRWSSSAETFLITRFKNAGELRSTKPREKRH